VLLNVPALQELSVVSVLGLTLSVDNTSPLALVTFQVTVLSNDPVPVTVAAKLTSVA